MADIMEKSYRLYSYMYSKYYAIENYTVEPTWAQEKGLWNFLDKDLGQKVMMDKPDIDFDTVLIIYMLVQFKHWSRWKPEHNIEIHWILGQKAWNRWRNYNLKYSRYGIIGFKHLLDGWRTSYEDIIGVIVEHKTEVA